MSNKYLLNINLYTVEREHPVYLPLFRTRGGELKKVLRKRKPTTQADAFDFHASPPCLYHWQKEEVPEL